MRLLALSAVVAVAAMTASQAQRKTPQPARRSSANARPAISPIRTRTRSAPVVKGVIGRTAGTHEGFKYSKAMIEAGAGGLKWDDATLTTYLHSPKETVKGTKMAFPGLKSDDDIANVIAYLKQFP